MKDIVDNRRRITWTKKIVLLFLVLKENGIRWCMSFAVYYLSSLVAEKSYSSMAQLRRSKGLPGLNSKKLNKAIWEAWDWSAAGEEWTPSAEWKESLIAHVLDKYVPKGGSLLEIGPGAGRWTHHLIEASKQFTAIDISSSCTELCQQKFAHARHASFLTGNGSDLAGVADCSLDGIWSFDVFVHINRREFSAYLDEFQRVMKPGSIAIVHHGSNGGLKGGWRSDMTEQDIHELLAPRNFQVIDMFKEWQDGMNTFKVGLYDDIVTVFCRKLPMSV